MTAPPVQQQDPMLRLQYYRETGQADQAKLYEQYLRETNQFKQSPAESGMTDLLTSRGLMRRPDQAIHDEYKVGNLARRMQTENAQEQAEVADEPSYAQRVFGGVAALGRNLLPGSERAQAGIRSVVQQQPYENALSDIHTAEASNPASAANALIGATIGAAAFPKIANSPKLGLARLAAGGPGRSAAQYGILSGLGSSETMPRYERLKGALEQGIVSGGIGAGINAVATTGRAMASPDLDEATVARNLAHDAASNANYAKAADETNALAGQPIPASLAATLNQPDIKPYTEAVASSRTFSTINDTGLPRAARLLRETYAEMSKEQSGIQKKFDASGYNVVDGRRMSDLGIAKDELLREADALGPGFRKAVEEHARMAGEREAGEQAADVAKRVANSTQVAGKKLETKSPAAFRRDVSSMTPGQANVARQDFLSSLDNSTGISPNPRTGFGMIGPFRAGTTLDALDARANLGGFQHGLSIQDLLKSLGIAVGQSEFPP